ARAGQVRRVLRPLPEQLDARGPGASHRDLLDRGTARPGGADPAVPGRRAGGRPMRRRHLVIAAVAALVVAVLFWLLLYQPAQVELADVREDIVAAQDQQRRLQVDIERLRRVREEAPEAEALLAGATSLVPRDPALPSALR